MTIRESWCCVTSTPCTTPERSQGSSVFGGTATALYGPGVLDMKAGTFLAVHALRLLREHGRQTGLPVTVMLIPDEEVGSPTTRTLIEAEGRRNRYVLVPEPAQDGGNLITGRWAFQRFIVRARGRPAHAGATLASGRSAIREIAEQIVRIESMSDPERNVTLSWEWFTAGVRERRADDVRGRGAGGHAHAVGVRPGARGGVSTDAAARRRRARDRARPGASAVRAVPRGAGDVRATPAASPTRSASTRVTAASAAAATATSPARSESPHSTAWVPAATPFTRRRSTSWCRRWCRGRACLRGYSRLWEPEV